MSGQNRSVRSKALLGVGITCLVLGIILTVVGILIAQHVLYLDFLVGTGSMKAVQFSDNYIIINEESTKMPVKIVPSFKTNSTTGFDIDKTGDLLFDLTFDNKSGIISGTPNFKDLEKYYNIKEEFSIYPLGIKDDDASCYN